MSTTTDSTITPKSAGGSAPMRELLPQAGDLLGHCRVIEQIAAGGMANVYKVWHEQLEVIRALKILKPGFSEEARGRLETEAKISANLRHTNIVEIYGMGYWNDIPYIEMEFVDGPSLKELLEKNIRLPVPFSLSVVHCVCTALQFAYNQDMTLYGKVYDRLIHRDIKPANILLSARGVVKLADFGIARPSEASIHTVGSKVMGTFAYLSPEQLNGEKLDQRSDVYSLGTVLYEMLTGSKTFPQKLLAELVQRKSRGQFIPVGAMGIHLPRQLCTSVEKCLALDKGKRFCDAGEFDLELTSVLRKLASKTPEDIIRTYLKNPYSASLRRKRAMNFKPVISFTGILLGIIVLTLGALRLPSAVHHFFNDWKKQLLAVNTAPPPVATPDTEVAKEQVKPLVAVQQKQPVAAATRPAAPKATITSPVTIGLNAFAAGNYSGAVASLESVQPDQIAAPRQQMLVTLRLLESYIKTHQYDKATALTNGESVQDGLFFFLKSTLAQQKNQLDAALDAARVARATPSQIDHAIKLKASFQVASILHTIYSLKPNQNNLRQTRSEWEAFISGYCTGSGGTKECYEAHEKLSLLDQ